MARSPARTLRTGRTGSVWRADDEREYGCLSVMTAFNDRKETCSATLSKVAGLAFASWLELNIDTAMGALGSVS